MEMDTPSTTLGSWFNAVLRGILIVTFYSIGDYVFELISTGFHPRESR